MKLIKISKKDDLQISNKIQEYLDEADKNLIEIGDYLKKAIQAVKSDKSMTSEEAEEIDYVRVNFSANLKAVNRIHDVLKREVERRLS